MRLFTQFVTVARDGPPHALLRAAIAAAHGQPWLDDLGIPDDSSWVWRSYRSIGNYDNRSAWAAVHVPVLLVFGGNERLVPPAQSIAEVTQILRSHARPRVRASTGSSTRAPITRCVSRRSDGVRGRGSRPAIRRRSCTGSTPSSDRCVARG